MPQEQVLLNNARTRYSKKEYEEICQAVEFAKSAHRGQVRKSGEKYIYHPLETAKYLADLQLDSETIIAAILHDTVEDTGVNLNDVKKQFGKEVAYLVEGVTKLSKIHLKKSWFGIKTKRLEEIPEFERQVENLRKMLLATSKDIRILLIKLADRLHNMKTLGSLPKDSQLRIATETLDIYAPLADRLGIGKWRGDLEDLAFPYVYPKEYKDLTGKVGRIIKRKKNEIERTKKLLIKYLTKKNIKYLDIHGRIKHLFSLWRKLARYDNDLSQIYDLVALRIIVQDESDCYRVLGIIHDHWRPLPDRIKDYIALPKLNGYQSIHTTVVGPGNRVLELQIRDVKMHENAEQGIAAHWNYDKTKPKKSRFSIRTKARPMPSKLKDWFSELNKWQKNIKDPKDLKDLYKFDFFKNRIFVYTPQGDVKNLPIGGTPIDFAYEVHTEVGNRCAGAKVNGKIVTLDFELQNGDVVEIITSRNRQKPNRDWLNFVKTSSARNHIRRYYRA